VNGGQGGGYPPPAGGQWPNEGQPPYPAGPLGGVLRCGTGPLGGGTAAACAWADSSTVGAMLTPQGGSVESLAGTTLDLRNAAER
jgi:hypothetical protein